MPHGIMFHHFYSKKHIRGQGAISADDLVLIIRTLGSSHFLSAAEWTERSLQGTLDDHHLCVTFDDALKCQYDVALPVLEDFGIKAFWFVYTGVFEGRIERLEPYRYFRTAYFESVDRFYQTFLEFLRTQPVAEEVEQALAHFDPRTFLPEAPFYTDADRTFRFIRDDVLKFERYCAVMDAMIADRGQTLESLSKNIWMGVEDLLTLDGAGHFIGMHSHTHPTRMAELSYEGQFLEYSQNFECLKKLLGKDPIAMSHPCNSYNQDTLTVLKALGVRLGFPANMLRPYGELMETPREDHANLLAKLLK